MQQPHEILGVSYDASEKTIKTAYKKLALIHHPDKGGDAEEFKKLSSAYKELLTPQVQNVNQNEDDESRNSGLWWNPYATTLNHKVVDFTMLENPFQYNNYEYIEKAFGRGEILDHDVYYFDKSLAEKAQVVSFMREKIIHIHKRLRGEFRTFTAMSEFRVKWYVSPEIIKEKTLFDENMLKVSCTLQLLIDPIFDTRALYDYSLGLSLLTNETLITLVDNMGGLPVLKQMVAMYPDIKFIDYLKTLNNSQLLTSANIEQTLSCINQVLEPYFSAYYESRFQFQRISIDKDTILYYLEWSLKNLASARLLTQENFNLLCDNIVNIEKLNAAFINLTRIEMLDQEEFLECIRLGKNARTYARNKSSIYRAKYFNEDLINQLTPDILVKCSHHGLNEIKKNGEDHQMAFQYQGPEATKPIEKAINQLFLYALMIDELKDEGSPYRKQAEEENLLCLCIAVEVKKSLYDFCQLNKTQQKDTYNDFKKEVSKILHEHDKKLSRHKNFLTQIFADILNAVSDFSKTFIPQTEQTEQAAPPYFSSFFARFNHPPLGNLERTIELTDIIESEPKPEDSYNFFSNKFW